MVVIVGVIDRVVIVGVLVWWLLVTFEQRNKYTRLSLLSN